MSNISTEFRHAQNYGKTLRYKAREACSESQFGEARVLKRRCFNVMVIFEAVLKDTDFVTLPVGTTEAHISLPTSCSCFFSSSLLVL